MALSGADVLELDHQVDLPQAAAITGPDIALWGNLDPVSLLAQGTPAQVRAATRALLERMTACGHRRFVLSSGCTLAVETPAENLEAMLDTARYNFVN
jgi:uroporphyrinogen-III decarboxylase